MKAERYIIAVALFAAAAVVCVAVLLRPRDRVDTASQDPRDDLPAAIAAPPAGALPAEVGAGADADFNFGYSPPTDEQRREFLQTLPEPTLREAAPHFFEARGPPASPASSSSRERGPVLLYRALLEAHQKRFGRPFVVGKQEIGDCVSWGWSRAVETLLAISYLNHTSGDFDLVATEATYGLARVEGAGKTLNTGGDGSYGAAAARGVTRFGVVLRRDYRDLASAEADLRIYAGSRAKAWGRYGCGGVDDRGRLDEICKIHPVRQVALVTTWEETVAAVKNGYPIAVCSWQGFASRRDALGFAAASGRWAHCMSVLGVRFDVEGVLILNSWGPHWIDGPKWPPDERAALAPLKLPAPFGEERIGGDGAAFDPLFRPAIFPRKPAAATSDQPDGSFWCKRSTWERMIAGRDTYALSDVAGFPRRELRFLDDF